MKITGKYTLDAPRQQVWDALNDIDVLARVVPGCQRLDQVGDHEYEGTIKVGIQAIKGTYNGHIRIEDIQAPEHYRLVINGRGANGVIDGTGTIDLAEQDGKTILSYAGDANIGGTLASVGQRLIDGASKQLLNQSLKALAEQIAARNSSTQVSSETTREQTTEQANPAAAPTIPSPTTTTQVASTVAANGVVPEAIRPSDPSPSSPLPKPPPSRAPVESAQETRARRTVVLPEDEQLQPQAVVQGIVGDFLKERPWLPWVVVAFLLGFIFGRSRR